MKITEKIGQTIKCIECNKEFVLDNNNRFYNGFCSGKCFKSNIDGRIMIGGGF